VGGFINVIVQDASYIIFILLYNSQVAIRASKKSMTNLPTFSHEVRFRMISVCKRSDDVGGFINVIV